MGYIRHHAIIVTSLESYIDKLYTKALEIFNPCQVGDIVVSTVNEYFSFLIGPDGSKEGWNESWDGNDNRQKFIDYLETFRYSDNSSPIDWVEIQYGDDDGVTMIINDSDKIIREVGYNDEAN